MSITTVAIQTRAGTTIGVLAEQLTPHLAVHPALVVDADGGSEYDHSAWELTHTPSGALVCHITSASTLRPSALRDFARWLEGQCQLADLEQADVERRLPAGVRAEIRGFAEAPNYWRARRCVGVCSAVSQ